MVGIPPKMLVLRHGRVRLVVVVSITRVHPAHGRLVVGVWQGVGIAVAMGGVDAGLLGAVAVAVEVVWVGVCREDIVVVRELGGTLAAETTEEGGLGLAVA